MTRPLALAFLLGVSSPVTAAQSLEFTYRTSGPEVHKAFEFVRESLQTSSAVIRHGRKEVIFGTVVSPDGHILTKASELGEVSELTVTVDRDSFTSPRLLAVDPVWDVALLKIDASNLIPVQLEPLDEMAQGTWVVANGATTRRNRRVQVGVVSANEREVFAKGGTVLGVELKEAEESQELTIASVTEGSGAETAGMLAGDLIRSVAGRQVATRKEIAEALQEKRVGDVVEVGLLRDGEELDLEVELSGRSDLFGEETTRNDMMSGEYSARRTGFPRIMQHDIIGNRHFMGGPVFNLDGLCVGMNIARFSRCETYAIPAKELKVLTDRLLKEATTQP